MLFTRALSLPSSTALPVDRIDDNTVYKCVMDYLPSHGEDPGSVYSGPGTRAKPLVIEGKHLKREGRFKDALLIAMPLYEHLLWLLVFRIVLLAA
jgi:hypothetical protein